MSLLSIHQQHVLVRSQTITTCQALSSPSHISPTGTAASKSALLAGSALSHPPVSRSLWQQWFWVQAIIIAKERSLHWPYLYWVPCAPFWVSCLSRPSSGLVPRTKSPLVPPVLLMYFHPCSTKNRAQFTHPDTDPGCKTNPGKWEQDIAFKSTLLVHTSCLKVRVSLSQQVQPLSCWGSHSWKTLSPSHFIPNPHKYQ